jgi:5-deoxy-glucuronate isomerase
VSSDLLVPPSAAAADGTIHTLTPESAGWTYVGFEVLTLAEGQEATRETRDRELCVVVVSGHVDVDDWTGLGGREHPFEGVADAAYLPPGHTVGLRGGAGGCELGLAWAPAPNGGAAARVLPGSEITPESRGSGTTTREIHNVLMAEREAESLLVCEVQTPAGNWSSYPPHKHERDALPEETLLEETYYHRVDPAQGFVVQRVYSDDRSLDEAICARDRDVVLVPRGYHPVGVPPGYRSYYLNVMAGPRRAWQFHNDPDHEWLMT